MHDVRPRSLPWPSRPSWLVVLTFAAVCLAPRLALAKPMSDETFYEIIVLLSAVSVGYVITHLVVERLARRYSISGGVEYIVLGIVLGPVLGIIDADMTRDLRPVLLLGAGALGMLAGLELAPGTEKVRAHGGWRAALSITLFTALMVIVLPLLVAWAFGYDIEGDHAWTAALLLAGIVLLGSDGSAIRAVASELGARGPAPLVGAAIATRVRALATIGFGLLYAVVEANEILTLREPIVMLQALGLQVGAGVIIGLLFGVVVHRKLDERTLLTVVVGMVFLAGGFAFAFGVSAIFVNFVAGLTFARTSPHAGEATRTMRSIKQPFVIALFFFAGLEWVMGELWVYLMIVPFLLLRWLGRKLGGVLGGRLAGWSTDLSPATFAPGGLALAFALSIRLLYRNTPGIADVYGPLVVALVLLELTSLRAIRRWLVDVADVTPEQIVRSPPVLTPPEPRTRT
jgi:Kef-type K+ transport system membrane component KefB